MDNLLLYVKNLEIKFNTNDGVFEAVNNISFKINKGESIGIIGESGCGKSVTAMSILKLLQNNAIVNGEICYVDDNRIIDINKLKSGNCANTVYNGITITLDFVSNKPNVIRIFGLRSFGESLYHSITDGCLEFGYKSL